MTISANSFFSLIQMPTPTEELCKDPKKLADLLSKMQARLNTENRRFRVVKCPNIRMAFGLPGFSVEETVVNLPNPGFQVGAVIFSHAIPTKTGDGQTSPAEVSGPGWLRNLKIQTGGGISFQPVVPCNPAPAANAIPYFDVYVVLMEGEGTVK